MNNTKRASRIDALERLDTIYDLLTDQERSYELGESMRRKVRMVKDPETGLWLPHPVWEAAEKDRKRDRRLVSISLSIALIAATLVGFAVAQYR